MKCTSGLTMPAKVSISSLFMVVVDQSIVGHDKSLHSFLLMLFHTSTTTDNLAPFVLFETNVHCACKGKLYLIIVGY